MSSDYNLPPKNYASSNPLEREDGDALSSNSSSKNNATNSDGPYEKFIKTISEGIGSNAPNPLNGRGKVHDMINRAASKSKRLALRLLRPLESRMFANEELVTKENLWSKDNLVKAKNCLKDLKNVRSSIKSPVKKAQYTDSIIKLRKEINRQRIQLKVNSKKGSEAQDETAPKTIPKSSKEGKDVQPTGHYHKIQKTPNTAADASSKTSSTAQPSNPQTENGYVSLSSLNLNPANDASNPLPPSPAIDDDSSTAVPNSLDGKIQSARNLILDLENIEISQIAEILKKHKKIDNGDNEVEAILALMIAQEKYNPDLVSAIKDNISNAKQIIEKLQQSGETLSEEHKTAVEFITDQIKIFEEEITYVESFFIIHNPLPPSPENNRSEPPRSSPNSTEPKNVQPIKFQDELKKALAAEPKFIEVSNKFFEAALVFRNTQPGDPTISNKLEELKKIYTEATQAVAEMRDSLDTARMMFNHLEKANQTNAGHEMKIAEVKLEKAEYTLKLVSSFLDGINQR